MMAGLAGLVRAGQIQDARGDRRRFGKRRSPVKNKWPFLIRKMCCPATLDWGF